MQPTHVAGRPMFHGVRRLRSSMDVAHNINGDDRKLNSFMPPQESNGRAPVKPATVAVAAAGVGSNSTYHMAWRQFMCLTETYGLAALGLTLSDLDRYRRSSALSFLTVSYLRDFNEFLVVPDLVMICLEYASEHNLVHRLVGGGSVMGTMLDVTLTINGQNVRTEEEYRRACALKGMGIDQNLVVLEAKNLSSYVRGSYLPVLNTVNDLHHQLEALKKSSTTATTRPTATATATTEPGCLMLLTRPIEPGVGAPPSSLTNRLAAPPVVTATNRIIVRFMPWQITPLAKLPTLNAAVANSACSRSMYEKSDYDIECDEFVSPTLVGLLTQELEHITHQRLGRLGAIALHESLWGILMNISNCLPQLARF